MAIAYFRVSRLPSRVSVENNAVPVVQGTSIPIAQEVDIDIVNPTAFKGEFLDNMEIQVSQDDIKWSSPVTIPIKELVGVNTPESIDAGDTVVGETQYVPYDLALFPINASVDRIRITAISGLGNWTFDGQPLEVGTEVFMHELPLIGANTLKGAGIPYMSMSYRCGNHIGYNELTDYLIELNLPSLAEIAGGDVFGSNPITEVVNLTKALSNKIAKVDISITGDMFTQGPASEVTINYNGTSQTYLANGTDSINVLLDPYGEAVIEVVHNYSNFGVAATSNVALTVSEVDANPANVSLINSYTSTAVYS